MKWAVAFGVSFALGCSNNLNSLFVKSAARADAGTATVKPEPVPLLPAQPDMAHRVGCEQCAKDACDVARMNCLEDDDCTAELRCKGKCSDPACLQTCGAESSSSSWYRDYAICVFGQCPTECNTGHNFDCQGNYDWPATESGLQSSFEVTFNFAPDPISFMSTSTIQTAGVGLPVQACADAMICSDLDHGVVGIDGKVKLTLSPNAIPPRDFRGYLKLDDDGYGEGQLLYTPPLSRSQTCFVGTIGSNVFPPGTDRSRPLVIANVSDCLGLGVPSARVSLPDLPQINAMAFVGFVAWSMGPTSAAGIAALVDLPGSAISTKVRVHAERSDGSLISERAVWVRPGFATALGLMPAARSD